MSHGPHAPPNPTVDYAHAASRPSGLPPTMGVLAIVYASLGLLIRAPLLALTLAAVADPSAWGLDRYTTGAALAEVFLNASGTALAVWLLVAGIGLTRRREWGRRGTVVWGWLMIATVAISLVLSLAFERPGVSAAPARQQGALAAGVYVGLVCINSLRLAFPVLCVALLTRPSARRAVW